MAVFAACHQTKNTMIPGQAEKLKVLLNKDYQDGPNRQRFRFLCPISGGHVRTKADTTSADQETHDTMANKPYQLKGVREFVLTNEPMKQVFSSDAASNRVRSDFKLIQQILA